MLTMTVSAKISVLLAPLAVRTMWETTEGVPGGVLVLAPVVFEVCPRWESLAGGVSGSTFLFCPTLDPTCLSSQSSLTLSPEDHDQTFASEFGYTKRLGSDRSFFATVEPQYGTGYPVQFQNGSGRLPPHLTFDASFGRDAKRGKSSRLGFEASFTNFTNTKYLLKINNGFNTTQWGPGFRSDLRVTAPF